MEQQTAVEWLIRNVNENIPPLYIPKEVVDHAKSMERQQHGKTWDKALDTYENRGHLYVRAWTNFDDYYNETYGK